MTKIPSSLLSVPALMIHIITIPLFFLGFVLLYDSAWIYEIISGGTLNNDHIVFNTLMLTSILIGVLCVSRIPMTANRKNVSLSWWIYICWSLLELIIFCAFGALYIAVTYGWYGYFPAVGDCFRVAIFVLPYPYLIFALLIVYIRPDRQEAAEEDLVRFTDSTGRLKLVIAYDVILYIEARENYISIHYMEGEKMKEYSLRQSMRGIEQLMEKHGIIRCQRSYFVNPRHVTLLRRDKEGFITAELDVTQSKPVPVSPKYYENLSQLL